MVKKKSIKEELEEVAKEEVEETTPLLSTGCTLLNVALSGKAEGGIPIGTIVNPAGKTHAGKSLMAMGILAEAAKNSFFDDYELHLQDTENGALFNILKFFGRKLQKRIVKKVDNSMEEFFTCITEMSEQGKKFIYIIDSYDGLLTTEDIKRKQDIQKAHREGKAFQYQDYARRAKFGHELCRNIVSDLAKNGSIIINLSQQKEKMNTTPFEDSKTRSGGKSLDFYSHILFWLSKGAVDKYTEGNVVIRNGHWVNCNIDKNRVNGRSSVIKFYITPEYGIDDIVTNIEFLDSINKLPKEKRSYIIDEWDFRGTKDTLIPFIEDNNKEEELAIMVETAWNELIEAKTKPRKRKYA